MKNLFTLFSLFCLYAICNAQTQIGQNLYGTSNNDLLGYQVSMSSNGNIIAISSPFFSNTANYVGSISVYENQNGSWVQLGQPIEGSIDSQELGFVLDISDDGNVIAFTTSININDSDVRVYKNINGTWTPYGQDIIGDSSNPYSISLSSDGSIIAVGEPITNPNGTNSGTVSVYENINGTWTQKGQQMTGDFALAFFGYDVKLTPDGSKVLVGAANNNFLSSLPEEGYFKIFEYQSNNWIQIGGTVYGSPAEFFGYRVSMSDDGNTVAVGEPFDEDNEIQYGNSGKVQVFELTNGSWVQKGQDIIGNDGDNFGQVALSSDGNVLAIGGPNFIGSGIGAGVVRVYKFENSLWVQKGNDLNGLNVDDAFGFDLDLSSDGNSIIIGAHGNDFVGSDSGLVQVYDLSTVLSLTDNFTSDFKIYPNPVTNQSFNVISTGLNGNVKIEIYSMMGKRVIIFKEAFVNNQLTINTQELKSGIYLLKVTQGKNSYSTKLIIN